jgi:hypothetical protein
MPPITLLGWIHTGIAIIALISGFYTLAVYRVITPQQKTGVVYLVCTFIAAATALMIYKHGGFGAAHGLAVLTLVGLAGGLLVMKIPFFGNAAKYLQAFAFSSTLLFHMIPAITDGLLRLPVGNPVLTDPHHPLLRTIYLAFLLLFLVGYALQVLWIHRQAKAG